jgi:hypothetical protein
VLRNASTSGYVVIGQTTFSSPGFRVGGGCVPSTTLAPGASCTLNLIFSPTGSSGSRASFVRIETSPLGPYQFPLTGLAVAAPPSPTVNVIEYYNASLDHYFMSSLEADITALDSGAIPGWSRTGSAFRAYVSQQSETSPVCRFYLPAGNGDSHFYSASPAECSEVQRKFPTFVLESPAVMYMRLPAVGTGECAAGLVTVYRVWNARVDSNHRYTTDIAVRDAMVAAGGIAEGYGPNAVIMCAAP